MPWVNGQRRNHGETSPGQKVLNVAAILAIAILFLTVLGYRTSIDTLENRVSSLSSDLSGVEQGGGGTPVSAASDNTDSLRTEISEVREQVGSFSDDLETLASKSVDIRSMEVLRDELLAMKRKMAEIEAGVEGLDIPSRQDDKSVSAEDVAAALSQARVARAELKKFKTMLGYGDM